MADKERLIYDENNTDWPQDHKTNYEDVYMPKKELDEIEFKRYFVLNSLIPQEPFEWLENLGDYNISSYNNED